MNEEETKRSADDLTDEELLTIINSITNTDDTGKIYVFPSEDEAKIWAAGLQIKCKEIIFCRINKGFSIDGGDFWTVEPFTADTKDMIPNAQLDNPYNEYLAVPDARYLYAIIEYLRRRKAEYDAEQQSTTLN